MTQRINYMAASPLAMKAMFGLQAAVDRSGLEQSLLELIKLRASQINGVRLLHRNAFQRCQSPRGIRRTIAPAQRVARGAVLF